jgi:acyl-coenzyme A thioesterase PaaI-like protein
LLFRYGLLVIDNPRDRRCEPLGPNAVRTVDTAAHAVRRLTAAILGARRSGVADPDVATEIARLADRLEQVAVEPEECVTGQMAMFDGILDRSPVTGRRNPIAPPLQFDICDDESVLGRCEFGRQYQGPLDHVHGGVAGLVLDVAMAAANAAAGATGVTAEMTLRYLRPTPLHTEVIVRGRNCSAQGRKIRADAVLEVGGEPTVLCDGLFIVKELTS